MSTAPHLVRRLGPVLVQEFAEVRNELKVLERREKELNSLIKEQMTEKNLAVYAPDKCPYKLLLATSERREINWQEEWEKLAEKHFGRSWRKKKEDLKANAPAVPLLRLSVEPNP